MTPNQEIDYLKDFIKLTYNQAVKRDMLLKFLDSRDKVLRLDADSLAYNVASFWVKKDEGIDLEEMYSDFHAQVRSIVNAIEDSGTNIIDIYYYFTVCKNNFRYALSKDYKAKREQTPTKELARQLIEYTIQQLKNTGLYVDYSDTLEGDDLISIHAKEFGYKDYVTCSIDKDLKQILGAHFDYYKVKTGTLDEYGNEVKEYQGWAFITPNESLDMFLCQMLVGDQSDGVKGVSGIGKVKAAKLLDGRTNYGKLLAVGRAYGDPKRLRLNTKLMRL